MPVATFRPLVVAIPADDLEQLRLIACFVRGQQTPAVLVAQLIRDYLAGPGRREVLRALGDQALDALPS